MLKQRIITAAILTAVFLLVLFVGSIQVFNFFIGFVVTVAAWEWASLSGIDRPIYRGVYASVLSGFAALLIYSIFIVGAVPLILVLRFSGLWWVIALIAVRNYPRSAEYWGAKLTIALLGFVVLLPTLVALNALRAMVHGQWIVLGLVFLVAIADIGAYFAGRAFGERKLAPLVSPGKTWAGVCGGLFAVTLVTVIFTFVSGSSLLLTLCVVLPTAVVSVLGDLFESMLKRHRGIKDSSNLLPGHGGILDRVDGLLAAAPVFALAIVLTGWQS